MTLSQTTQLQSDTETAWSKSESQLKTSKGTSKTNSTTGSLSAKLFKSTGKADRTKYVYFFGNKKADGQEDQKNLLGGKGANLHGMTRLGLPVPSGFTITTEVCTYFYAHDKYYPKALEAQVMQALKRMEKEQGRIFGSTQNPLLVSVRSGARASMPGMMDTILNLGLNDKTIQGLIQESKDARFSYDSYRRFITMYSDVVLGIHSNHFEAALEDMKHSKGVELDTELTAEDLTLLIQQYKQIIKLNGQTFPEDPWEQLWGAIGAVFSSWMNPRAITYRKLNDIPQEWGTAVISKPWCLATWAMIVLLEWLSLETPLLAKRNFLENF